MAESNSETTTITRNIKELVINIFLKFSLEHVNIK